MGGLSEVLSAHPSSATFQPSDLEPLTALCLSVRICDMEMKMVPAM